MAKFHINGNGEAGACRAEKGGCPFGSESEHFTTPEAAREAYEARMNETGLESTSKVKKPVYEAVQPDGTRGFTVTYAGGLGGGTSSKTVYAKTASEARKSVAKTLPHLAKITDVKRKLYQSPEDKDEARRSSVDNIRAVDLQRRIDEEFSQTELGAQFKPNSLQASKDGRTLTGVVEEGFTDRGVRYDEGEVVRFNNQFRISHSVSKYNVSPESLSKRKLFQEPAEIRQEINRVASVYGQETADDVYALLKEARTITELRKKAGDLKEQSDKYGSYIHNEFNATRDESYAKTKELEAKGYAWRDVIVGDTSVRPASELATVVRKRKEATKPGILSVNESLELDRLNKRSFLSVDESIAKNRLEAKQSGK